MKFSLKKFLSLFLTVTLAFTAFIACKQDSGDGGSGDGSGSSGGGSFEITSITYEGKVVTDLSLLLGQPNVEIEAKFSGNGDKKTTWTSSNESVAKVVVSKQAISYEAKIRIVAEGTATITAKDVNGKTASLSVTVLKSEYPVNDITLYMCNEDNTFDLNAKANETVGSFTYTVENATIAKVENGILVPLKAGKTNLIVKESATKKEKVIPITIYNSFVNATINSALIKIDEEINIPFVSDRQGVTYSTVDQTIAVVIDNKVKGLKVGVTTLNANYNGNVVASITVEVVENKINTYTVVNNINDENINYYGKNYFYNNAMAFSYGASGFEVSFYGTELKATMFKIHSNGNNFIPEMQVLVDGEKVPDDSLAKKVVVSSSTATEYTLVSGLSVGVHTVKVLKRSGFVSGGNKENIVGLKQVKTDGYFNKAPQKPTLKIEVIGDSITHGYGNLTDGSQPYANITNGLLTYAYLAGEKLGAEVRKQGHSGWGIYLRSSGEADPNTQWYTFYDKYFKYNGSFSKETWNANDNFSADIVVINLGTNDSSGVSKGTYKSEDFIAHYKTIIEGLKAKHPNAKFVLSYGMMGTNATVMADIKAVANSYDYAEWLNFTDYRSTGGHPLVSDHRKNADELYNKIVSMLNA